MRTVSLATCYLIKKKKCLFCCSASQFLIEYDMHFCSIFHFSLFVRWWSLVSSINHQKKWHKDMVPIFLWAGVQLFVQFSDNFYMYERFRFVPVMPVYTPDFKVRNMASDRRNSKHVPDVTISKHWQKLGQIWQNSFKRMQGCVITLLRVGCFWLVPVCNHHAPSHITVSTT